MFWISRFFHRHPPLVFSLSVAYFPVVFDLIFSIYWYQTSWSNLKTYCKQYRELIFKSWILTNWALTHEDWMEAKNFDWKASKSVINLRIFFVLCSSDCKACLVVCFHDLGFQLTWREFSILLDFLFMFKSRHLCSLVCGFYFQIKFLSVSFQSLFRSSDFCVFISKLSWNHLQAFMRSQIVFGFNRSLFFKSILFLPFQIVTNSYEKKNVITKLNEWRSRFFLRLHSKFFDLFVGFV